MKYSYKGTGRTGLAASLRQGLRQRIRASLSVLKGSKEKYRAGEGAFNPCIYADLPPHMTTSLTTCCVLVNASDFIKQKKKKKPSQNKKRHPNPKNHFLQSSAQQNKKNPKHCNTHRICQQDRSLLVTRRVIAALTVHEADAQLLLIFCVAHTGDRNAILNKTPKRKSSRFLLLHEKLLH